MTIVDAFRIARGLADRSALFTAVECPPFTCRYCGKHRAAWCGTRLDGHARCIVGPEFMELALRTLETSATLTMRALGDQLGVTQSVIRAWYRYAIDARPKTMPVTRRRAPRGGLGGLEPWVRMAVCS